KQITDLPKEYQEKIKAIQDNKNLTTEEKADKIVSVYEDFLYSLASEAFDEYTKMRKKEHKGSIEWAKGELKLTNKLMGCNVDIKSLVRHLGDDIILISDKKGWNYIQFINMVNTGKPLDLKARVCKNTNFSIWARNWSDKMTIKGENRADDYLGNYLFGYYGQGVLKLGGKNIVMGAGVAQTLSNLKNKKIKITKKIDGLYQGVGAIENMVFNGGVQVVGDAVKSIPNKKVKNIGNKIDNLGENIPSFPLEDGPYSMLHGYGDNAGDGEMIKEGIEDYEKLHK
ncbi:MAG: DUF1542 domain-containing protein, partial [Lachnospiraceae bacterium]|nr:DUF1542 domain-containing protein [Lachnospiraceae bacterium]